MDNRYYDNVISEMKPFFDENKFKALDDGSFVCETKKVKVEYNEEKQIYSLLIADVENGQAGEFVEASSWLFDDSQNAKDAFSVGVDFTATLRENMGIKIKRKVSSEIDLPTATKSGSYTISGFAKKMLDIFPAFKDLYKEHVALYGKFLYLSFMGENLVPQMKEILLQNDKKSVKKLIDFMGDCFNKGDCETVNAVVAATAAAIYNDDTLNQNFFAAAEDEKYYSDAVKHFLPVFPSNKKLVSLLIK